MVKCFCDTKKWSILPAAIVTTAAVLWLSTSEPISDNDVEGRARDTIWTTGIKRTPSIASKFSSLRLHRCPPISEILDCPEKNVEWKKGEPETVPCWACAQKPWTEIYKAGSTQSFSEKTSNSTIGNSNKPIYLQILTPPKHGSTVLLNTISSSPAVSNMCTDPYGGTQIPPHCESKKVLLREGVLTEETLWDAKSMNWTAVYDVYNRLDVWSNRSKPILVDKSPPNIAKSEGLVNFLESNNMDYRVLVMWKHPCRKRWSTARAVRRKPFEEYMTEILQHVPKSRRFLINYDDLVLRPDTVIPRLLSWLPELQSISLDKSMTAKAKHRRKLGMHMSSLKDYTFSGSCKMKKDVEFTTGKENDAWTRFSSEIEAEHM